MGESDYQTGYRGGKLNDGMDAGEYHRGKGQKELEDTLGGTGKKVEVDGVAYTLLIVSPFIWMVYPVLGFTLMAVVGAVFFLGTLLVNKLHFPSGLVFLVGLFPAVGSFFWGFVLEKMLSQNVVYRWIRGFLRIVFAFVLGVALGSGGKIKRNAADLEPGGIVLGFFVAVIAWLTFQRMDLIYFPAKAEIKKLVEMVDRGERPKRPLLKRMFFGFCWLIPVVMVLNLILAIGVRTMMEGGPAEREAFYQKLNGPVFIINTIIWYVLCLTGWLPGTGKYMFSERHEQDLKKLT